MGTRSDTPTSEYTVVLYRRLWDIWGDTFIERQPLGRASLLAFLFSLFLRNSARYYLCLFSFFFLSVVLAGRLVCLWLWYVLLDGRVLFLSGLRIMRYLVQKGATF